MSHFITTYEIQKRFVHEKYLNKGEITIAMLNESFFDLVCILNGITASELKDWKKGKLTLYLYEKRDVPYIVFQFGNWSLDININVLKAKDDEIANWLASDSNLINLFLIDEATGILKAMRTISVPKSFADEIRNICEKQLTYTVQDIDRIVMRTIQEIPTDVMMRHSIRKYIVR